MKLILKEVEDLRADLIDEAVVNSLVHLYSRIWEGKTPDTCLVEIEFNNSKITFASYLKDGNQMFEFMDLDEDSCLYGNAFIFELPLEDYNGYEVV